MDERWSKMHRAALLVVVAVIVMDGCAVAAAGSGTCRGEGLRANHTAGCRDYYKCRNGRVAGAYSCPAGFVFNEAARQCLSPGEAPCVRHLCDPSDAKFYAAPGTQCRYYYKCERGSALELACPPGSWFDYARQRCARSAGVCYEPVCTGQTDGRYPDATQACERSLRCAGGALAAVESPGPLEGGPCPSPRTTSVAFPIAASDRCATLSDGAHAAPGVRCKDYFVCRDGETRATLRCPEGRRFDGRECADEATTPCADECADAEDGFHADPATGCRDYVYCQDRKSLLRTTCAEGALFDGQMCVSAALFTCPTVSAALRDDVCLGKSDGYHRDFNDCKSFVLCSREAVKFRDSCPAERVWNGSACVDPGEFRCEGPAPWPKCLGKAPGYHQDRSTGSDCRRYYHCSHDMRTDFECGAGRLFNGEECVDAALYTCPSLERDSCERKADGYYQQSGADCRAYYMCSGGGKSIFLCDVGKAFDGERCVDERDFECPHRSRDCEGRANGYHQDANANCRKYFFCEGGRKLITLQCSGSKVFNGRGCVSAKEYRCPTPAAGANPCAQRPDGHYGQDGTKCRQYYKCGSQKLISRQDCPAGRVFDGRSGCVDKKACLAGQTVTCEKNGFFADLRSRCTQYHVCIDKRKSTLRCDEGKVFDGQLCVPENSYVCPDECSQCG